MKQVLFFKPTLGKLFLTVFIFIFFPYAIIFSEKWDHMPFDPIPLYVVVVEKIIFLLFWPMWLLDKLNILYTSYFIETLVYAFFCAYLDACLLSTLIPFVKNKFVSKGKNLSNT